MDAKTANMVRAMFTDLLTGIEADGFEYAGLTKEGVAFSDGMDTVMLRTVVKQEGFDLETAVAEKTLADELAAERKSKSKAKKATPKPKPTEKKVEKTKVDEVVESLFTVID